MTLPIQAGAVLSAKNGLQQSAVPISGSGPPRYFAALQQHVGNWRNSGPVSLPQGQDESKGLWLGSRIRCSATLNTSLGDRHPAERLKWLRGALGGRIVLSTGFGLEGQVLFHLIAENELDIDVITLDTGRLFPETYALRAETERRYGRRVTAIYPDTSQVEALVTRQGNVPQAPSRWDWPIEPASIRREHPPPAP